ncbi:phage major capsid protein [Microbacterium sp. 22195]|uniref:phage major capsid protein n=1 Tax=Microbacterium sp. 22195 TaxID=3453891 RepID=UPI003F8401A0
MTDELNPSAYDASNLAFGNFSYDAEARILRGLLVPFGERSRKSVTGDVAEFSADTLDLPRDHSIVGLNRDHNPYDAVGRATSLTVTDHGVEAAFQLADTDQADDWLTGQKATLRKLSPEVVWLDSTKTRARLTGAALVTEGAFASAALFALAPEEDEDPETPEAEEAEDMTPEADPAQETPTDESEEDTVSSIVPDMPGAVSPANDTEAALFAAIANRNSNPDALVPFAGAGAAFAIQNVQASGPTGKTIEADVTVPQAVRELWKRQAYSQRFLPLVNSGTLTSPTVTGWRWITEPTVADYAGNLAEVPSTAVDTEPVTAQASILAGGNKLDRKFYDFNDSGVVQSFLRLQTESVARQMDAKALAAIVAGATATTAGTVPADVAKGLAAIVDGAQDVIASENRPSFAIVDPSLWRDIVLMKDRDKLAFLDAGFGLEEGDVTGFKIVPGAVGAGKVIVGAREALTFYTLGGGAPIRVEGLDVHHGGVDVAVFAYYASILNNGAALRVVDTAVVTP